MKTSRKNKLFGILIASLTLSIFGCGGMSTIETSLDETNDTNNENSSDSDNTSAESTIGSSLALRFETVASSLVPDISETSASASMALALVSSEQGNEEINLSNATWNYYNEDENIYHLTDIFGDLGGEFQPVSRVRVLLRKHKRQLSNILRKDPTLSCAGSANKLNEGDQLSLPYFEEVSNGSEENRFYRCIIQNNDEQSANPNVIIYGMDNDDVLRVAIITDRTSSNNEQVLNRGKLVRGLSIIHSTYIEQEEDSYLTGYLDLQYTQATIYSGLDGVFGSGDEVEFKSRSRITGWSVLDDSDDIIVSVGDFSVTKFDLGINEDGHVWERMTGASGRGAYGDGENFLFKIKTNDNESELANGSMCLESASEELPSLAKDDNCEFLVDRLPWADGVFPFELESDLETVFADKILLDDSEEDLIESSGANFIVPDYKILVEVEPEEPSEEESDDTAKDNSEDNNDDDLIVIHVEI